MPVTPDDFLNSALSFDDSFNEMSLRNRVSRAYYGAYLLAKNKQSASKVGTPHAKGGVHAQLIEFYTQGLMPGMLGADQIEIAGLLKTAKTLRTKADYKLNLLIPISDGEVALQCAQQVHKLLN